VRNVSYILSGLRLFQEDPFIIVHREDNVGRQGGVVVWMCLASPGFGAVASLGKVEVLTSWLGEESRVVCHSHSSGLDSGSQSAW
jgi:hypothetical protein